MCMLRHAQKQPNKYLTLHLVFSLLLVGSIDSVNPASVYACSWYLQVFSEERYLGRNRESKGEQIKSDLSGVGQTATKLYMLNGIKGLERGRSQLYKY